MKKIYKTPLIKTAELDVNSIIASSPEFSLKSKGEINDVEDVMSRDGGSTNLWDNEW